MLDTHKLPAGKSSCGFVKPPSPGQDAENTIRAKQLNLDITSSLVIDPDSSSHMLQSSKVGFFKHLLRHLECRFDTVDSDITAAGGYFGTWIWLLLFVVPLVVIVLSCFQ